MAEILPFAISALRRVRPLLEGSGEVVIFPGIRVEYHDVDFHDGTPQPPTKRQRRGKRKSETGALSA